MTNAQVSSLCATCRFYGIVGGGDVVPYGSTTARLPYEYGCSKELDCDEDGEPKVITECGGYEEIPKCPKHPNQYLDPDVGCPICYEEYLKEGGEDYS